MSDLYDEIGRTYTRTRAAEPRIAAAIERALGDARTVVNVGAGTGSYESTHRLVQAVEPSRTMIAQRPRHAAPVLRALAEDLPFADEAFDASMALLSDHHWTDRKRGLRELRRVARRTVVFTWEPRRLRESWLVRDYFVEFADRAGSGMTADELAAALGGAKIIRVPIPHDCRDGFLHAYWRRPEAYLDPQVRAGISVFSALPEAAVAAALRRLEADLASGAWRARNAALLDLEESDLGYRLIVAEASEGPPREPQP
jgi:SAM-dependent methyltransferase